MCRQGAPLGDALFYLLCAVIDEPHVSILACCLQAIVAGLHVGNLLRHAIAEGLRGPKLDIVVSLGRLPAIDIPSQIHHKRDLLLGRLDVTHIEHPNLAGTIGIGLGEFRAQEDC